VSHLRVIPACFWLGSSDPKTLDACLRRHDVNYTGSFCLLRTTFILLRAFKSICKLAMKKCEIYGAQRQDASIKWDSSDSAPFIHTEWGAIFRDNDK